MNFPDDDVDITPENSEISCLKTQSLRVDEENDANHSLNNNTLPLNPQVAVQVWNSISLWNSISDSMVKHQALSNII